MIEYMNEYFNMKFLVKEDLYGADLLNLVLHAENIIRRYSGDDVLAKAQVQITGNSIQTRWFNPQFC
jgi:hypothetical protein